MNAVFGIMRLGLGYIQMKLFNILFGFYPSLEWKGGLPTLLCLFWIGNLWKNESSSYKSYMFSSSLSQTFAFIQVGTYYIVAKSALKLFELRYEVPAKSWPLTCSADERSSQKETFDGRQQEYSIWVINFPPLHSTLEKGRDYTRKIVGFSWFFPLTRRAKHLHALCDRWIFQGRVLCSCDQVMEHLY